MPSLKPVSIRLEPYLAYRPSLGVYHTLLLRLSSSSQITCAKHVAFYTQR
jgi:hypothetical protein